MLELFSSIECQTFMAKELLRGKKLTALAEKFRRSVERFAAFTNLDEPFYPISPPRKDLPDVMTIADITDTLSLTAFLDRCRSAQVDDDPELGFVYVDREIVPARKTGKAVFENGDRSTCYRRLDWLLTNARDGLPIIAEVKVGTDKNAFSALLQLLMYAAELATPAQQKRLRQHYPKDFASCDAAEDSTRPSLDTYIILSKQNPRSRERQEILKLTSEICHRLLIEDGMTRYIRRISCLEATLDTSRQLRFKKLFSYSAQ
jgi:hypothetical protein